MKRFVINEFEKIVSEDLNDIQTVFHQSLYDKILYPFLQKLNGCLGDSFLCAWASATTVTVKAGRAFYYDNTQVGYEPKYRAIQLAEDLTLTLGTAPWAAAPSNPNNRYDIIVIRPKENVVTTAARYIRTNGTGPISLETVDKIKEQQYEIDVVEGTADPSPSIPATPAGWIKIANVYITGGSNIASSSDVVDTRVTLVPYIPAYQNDTRYVSPAGNGTDTTLAGAIANLPVGGGSVIILEAITLTATHNIPANTLLRGRGRSTIVTIGASGKLVLQGNNSKMENLEISTAQAALNPMVQVDGNDCEISSCLFDLPAAQTNLALKATGTGFNIGNCNFTNCDKDGTNTSFSITGTVSKSFGRGNLQGSLREIVAVTTTYAMAFSDANRTLNISSSAAYNIQLPAPVKGFRFFVKDIGGALSSYPVTLVRYGAEKIAGLTSSYVLESDLGFWEFFADGTDWHIS